MVFLESLALGLLFSLSTVGPITIEILRRSLKSGYFSALGIILGATIVDFVYLIIVFSGIYNFLNFTTVNRILTVFGIVYLLYLGYNNISTFNKLRLGKESKTSRKNSLLTGVLLGISSPYAFVFYLGVFGPLVTSADNLISGLIVGLTIIFGIFIGDNIKAIIGHFGRKLIAEKFIKYVSLTSSIGLVIFALYFTYQLLLIV